MNEGRESDLKAIENQTPRTFGGGGTLHGGGLRYSGGGGGTVSCDACCRSLRILAAWVHMWKLSLGKLVCGHKLPWDNTLPIHANCKLKMVSPQKRDNQQSFQAWKSSLRVCDSLRSVDVTFIVMSAEFVFMSNKSLEYILSNTSVDAELIKAHTGKCGWTQL